MNSRMVSSGFHAASSYLMSNEMIHSLQSKMDLIEDSDVGPIYIHSFDREIGEAIRSKKSWSPGEGRFLRNFLVDGMNVIDIGANIGYFTLLMSQQVKPNGWVLAIEPEPEMFTILQANVAQFSVGNVELLPVAAARASGLVTLSRDRENLGAHKSYVVPGAASYLPVQGIRVDDALDPEARVDFIKIDIEGMDHAAAEGMERTIHRWKPTLLVEFNPANIEAYGETPKDALALYRYFGFEIRILGSDVLILRAATGLDVDDLVCDSLVLTAEREDEIIERTRRVGLINLILTPRAGHGASHSSRWPRPALSWARHGSLDAGAERAPENS